MAVHTNVTNLIPDNMMLFMILESIARKLDAKVPSDIGLWSGNEIATYLKRDPRTVMKEILRRADFPNSIQLPSATGGKDQLLWKAKEVMEWADALIFIEIRHSVSYLSTP
ncbi:hypothetical protein SAMN05216412_11033 [Nitrosospira multiformis]|uniref:Uncharacterized protein n=1 Tax=Nitrosospira multiformis TaxID=1231 RepID=A0A1I0FSL0_9PROT|nr:hypothetical protein [Nitrosospira multiformis]SET61219.1 hypothetical protein SAMN05216412_11033 [Nitrosospira multiformis]